MNQILRFWVAIISLIVSVAAVGSLLGSFMFEGSMPAIEGRMARLLLTFVALSATGVLIWSTALSDSSDSSPEVPGRGR